MCTGEKRQKAHCDQLKRTLTYLSPSILISDEDYGLNY